MGFRVKLNNAPENKRKYNGIEFNEDLDLDIYDAYYRNLDPQVGRWWQIDPEIESMEAWSPYASNFDNPISNSDPLGDEPSGCCSVLDELLDIGEKTVLSLSGVVNGVLNTVSGGLFSTDPFSMRDNLDPEEQRLYDNSVQVGQIGGLFSASSRSPKLTPALQPVGGPAIPIALRLCKTLQA
ncbi:MAG: RHS repeat-associated core domain-containing protein [Agriterribacter sp.]